MFVAVMKSLGSELFKQVAIFDNSGARQVREGIMVAADSNNKVEFKR